MTSPDHVIAMTDRSIHRLITARSPPASRRIAIQQSSCVKTTPPKLTSTFATSPSRDESYRLQPKQVFRPCA